MGADACNKRIIHLKWPFIMLITHKILNFFALGAALPSYLPFARIDYGGRSSKPGYKAFDSE